MKQVYLEKFYNFKTMQYFFGLEESGDVDPQTVVAMRRARCGLSDVEPFRRTMRWTNRTLTYRISRLSSKLTAAQVRTAFRQAWKLWAQAVPLKFHRQRRSDADIIISFNNKDHEDGSPFDGEGGILAHTFFPGPGIGGDVHFDDEEAWTTNTKGCNLLAVAVHEFRHALGLPHSSDPGAIMFPAYNFGLHTVLQLSFQDVKDIQEMYGMVYSLKNEQTPVLRPKTPDKCDPMLSFDAVTGMQQEFVFFKDRSIWRVHPSFEQIGITLITSLWPDLPAHIDAAYENTYKNSMLVNSLQVRHGYSRSISEFGFPSTVKSMDAGQIMEGSPEPIAHEWPGVDSQVDAPVAHDGWLSHSCRNNPTQAHF
uniref:Peptidase metallopeptidase domain-containing protein n=1 Tax=Cyprinus carpio TaxID=7962 RepID=A0A8C1TWW6_CYPCA